MPELYMSWSKFCRLSFDVQAEAEHIAEDMFRVDENLPGIDKSIGSATFHSQSVESNGIPVLCKYKNALGVPMQKTYLVSCHKIKFVHFKGF